MSLRPEDLPEPGHPRPEVESPAAPLADVPVLGGNQRARADEAHLAAHHVQQLRQLVDAGAAQEPPDSRHPRVGGRLEHDRRRAVPEIRVEVRDLRPPRLGVDRHRPELPHPEPLVAYAHPLLAEEHRSAGVELDRRGNDQEQRGEEHEGEAREHEIDGPLEDAIGPGEAHRRHREQRDPLDRVHLHRRRDHLEEPRHDVDLDVEVLRRAHQVQRLLVRSRSRRRR